MKIKISDLRTSLTEAARKLPSESLVTTARAAVESTRPEIETLLRRGFTPREVSELLTQAGVKISTASLQTYLRSTAKKASDRHEEPQAETFRFQPLMEEDYGRQG